MLSVCTFSGLLSSSKMTSSSNGGVGSVSDGPLPSVKVSSHEIEKRKTSMLSEPRMTIGPGPAMDALQRHGGEAEAAGRHVEPGGDARLEVERAELHDGIDLQEAVRLDAKGNPDLPPAAELDGVGGDGEVALGAHLDDGDRIVDREPDAPQRREMRRLRVEARIEPADGHDEIAGRAPAEAHRRVAVDLEDPQHVAVDEAGVDRDAICSTGSMMPSTSRRRLSTNGRPGMLARATPRIDDLARRDLDDHREVEADEAALGTERQPRQLQRRADQVRAAVEREQAIGGDDQRQRRRGRADGEQHVAGGAGAHRGSQRLGVGAPVDADDAADADPARSRTRAGWAEGTSRP